VGMGHSKGERLLASAQPPAVPELPVALRVERRICFDVTQLKLREKAMELRILDLLKLVDVDV